MGNNNGRDSKIEVAVPSRNRVRASGPILILAILFVVASFLTWYLTWFGRGLSDQEITKYLSDYNHPRHVQHALLQVQERIVRGDKSAAQWYPQVVTLAENPEPEFRLTAAWVMGADNSSEDFHNALKRLLMDAEPIVRRNAALALVRFGDATSRPELLAILNPFTINAPAAGVFDSSLGKGAAVSRGTLLARIREPNDNVVAIRSPLPGTIQEIRGATGSNVNAQQPLLIIKSDDESLWEALRGLALVGTKDDLKLLESYANGLTGESDRIKQQAALTGKSIKSRIDSGEKPINQ
ncbi:MAG TPA: HEAT repeat domain-containing protein [Pyrinomonadaceae bacterium]|nr:HEAT repeat domain-containing protein [Pyrinomonadaceae bacterium]